MCHSREGSRCDIVIQQISPGLLPMYERKRNIHEYLSSSFNTHSPQPIKPAKRRVKEKKKEKRILHLKVLLTH